VTSAVRVDVATNDVALPVDAEWPDVERSRDVNRKGVPLAVQIALEVDVGRTLVHPDDVPRRIDPLRRCEGGSWKVDRRELAAVEQEPMRTAILTDVHARDDSRRADGMGSRVPRAREVDRGRFRPCRGGGEEPHGDNKCDAGCAGGHDGFPPAHSEPRFQRDCALTSEREISRRTWTWKSGPGA
jgi:hypothetical protein